MTTNVCWVYPRQWRHTESMSWEEHDSEDWNRRILFQRQWNCILWLGTDWEPGCTCSWSWPSWWCTIGTKFNQSQIVWHSCSKWTSPSFHDFSSNRIYKQVCQVSCLNCNGDKMAERFWKLRDSGDVKALKEGFFMDLREVGNQCQWGEGHVTHSPPDMNAYPREQASQVSSRQSQQMEQCHMTEHRLEGMKSGYLLLRALKWIKMKRVHGWLNTGRQKSKIFADAVESHKCPRCHKPNETHKHILKCWHVDAHRKWYDLVLPMLKKIHQNDLCSLQEMFTKCIKSWLESLETVIPDVSSVHETQC